MDRVRYHSGFCLGAGIVNAPKDPYPNGFVVRINALRWPYDNDGPGTIGDPVANARMIEEDKRDYLAMLEAKRGVHWQ